jgi:MFS family permease
MNKRLILIACFLTVFIAYAIRYGYGILLPKMLVSLDITKTDAGIIYSSFFIAYTVGSPLCGIISDRYGSRWLLTSFVIALGVGAFLMSYASSILQASLFFTLAGIGAAACWAPVVSLAQRWTRPEHRGKTLSLIDVGSALGMVATGAIVPVIVRAYDWRAGWMSLGVLCIAVGILNFVVVKNQPSVPDAKMPNMVTSAKPAGFPISKLLGNSKFWLFGIAYLFTGFSILIPFTFLSTYAVQELSLSYEVAATLLTVIGIGAIVSKLTIGPLSDKIGRLKIIFLCCLLIGLGNLGMAFSNVVVLFTATVVFSLGDAVWAMYAAAASDYFSRESSGTIVGLWTVFLGVGSVISPIVAGWLADTTGTLTWSFGLGAAAALVSIILLIPLWRKGRG